MLGGWDEMTEASEVVDKAKVFAEKMALECVGCGHDRYVCSWSPARLRDHPTDPQG